MRNAKLLRRYQNYNHITWHTDSSRGGFGIWTATPNTIFQSRRTATRRQECKAHSGSRSSKLRSHTTWGPIDTLRKAAYVLSLVRQRKDKRVSRSDTGRHDITSVETGGERRRAPAPCVVIIDTACVPYLT
jgi:hypothetical protein